MMKKCTNKALKGCQHIGKSSGVADGSSTFVLLLVNDSFEIKEASDYKKNVVNKLHG